MSLEAPLAPNMLEGEFGNRTVEDELVFSENAVAMQRRSMRGHAD